MSHEHFEHIDIDKEFSSHIREHYMIRKTKRILGIARDTFGDKPLNILDAGCGTGWYAKVLTENGHNVFGVDISRNFIAKAKVNSPKSSFVHGSMLNLPFQEDSFDISYTVNALHHLDSVEDQEKALKELARVTKKEGLIIIHEMNIRNPIIKFYLNHIFTKLHSIDTGVEIWLPHTLWENIEYFTFIPNFTPRFIFPFCKRIEALLEMTPLKLWGAHYMAVLNNNK